MAVLSNRTSPQRKLWNPEKLRNPRTYKLYMAVLLNHSSPQRKLWNQLYRNALCEHFDFGL